MLGVPVNDDGGEQVQLGHPEMLPFTCPVGANLFHEVTHHRDQVGFAFEPDARKLWHDDMAVFDFHAVGEPAIGLEQVWVALIAAEAEPGRDV